MYKKLLSLLLTALMVMSASTLTLNAQDETVILMTHDSFSVSEDVLAEFENETGIMVQILLAGDAGTMVNQAILSVNNPQADVLFGIDNTFLGRALENDLFEAYEAAGLDTVPDEFKLDTDNRVTPIDYGDVCLNYDKAYFAENGLALPTSFEDLTDDAYEGLLVVQNPATSSPGLAFLAATVAAFGEDGEYTYLDYWADLVENDVLVTPDWTTAYYGEFSGASDGDRPLVVSYASSPPAEFLFADPPVDEPPTGTITTGGMCFRQIEFAGILSNADNRAAAEQLIDFMLTERFQADVPLQMFVFPVNPAAELPQAFQDFAELAEEPAEISAEAINDGRNEWIQAWTETVLR